MDCKAAPVVFDVGMFRGCLIPEELQEDMEEVLRKPVAHGKFVPLEPIPPTLWLVGQYRSGEFPSIVWDFQGVFDTRQKAIDACVNPRYFIVPILLNDPLPDKAVEFSGLYYPGLTKEN